MKAAPDGAVFLLQMTFAYIKIYIQKAEHFCSAFQIAVLSLNFCYINVRSAQYIVHIAYATNAANLPYINVASNGSIDAYAPTPIPKITKTRTTYNITPTTPKHMDTRQPMPALFALAGCSSFQINQRMKPTIGIKSRGCPSRQCYLPSRFVEIESPRRFAISHRDSRRATCS